MLFICLFLSSSHSHTHIPFLLQARKRWKWKRSPLTRFLCTFSSQHKLSTDEATAASCLPPSTAELNIPDNNTALYVVFVWLVNPLQIIPVCQALSFIFVIIFTSSESSSFHCSFFSLYPEGRPCLSPPTHFHLSAKHVRLSRGKTWRQNRKRCGGR